MLKDFFKPNIWKVLTGIILAMIAVVLVFSMFVFPFPYHVMNFLKFLGLPVLLGSVLELSSVWLFPQLLLNLIWLYLLGCIIYFIVIKAQNIKWNKKHYSSIAGIVIVIIIAVLYSELGWSDVFVPTADDSQATSIGVREIVEANNQFAIDLYNELNKDNGGNLFFSPWSISTALVMTYEGARGETAVQMRDVLYFPEDDVLRRSAYARMLNRMNKAGGEYTLKTANALWLQEDYPFLDNYKTTVWEYYLAKVNNYNLAGDPSGASSEINSWVSKNTNGKIDEIVNPSMFTSLTRAVLANAIYFKGDWVHKFDKDDTKDEDFTLESGQTVKVPMMKLVDNDLEFRYAESDGVQILELPYKGDKLSMLVLLPRTETPPNVQNDEHAPEITSMDELESILSADKLTEWRSKLSPTEVHIYLPKFTFETSYSLKDHLSAMGMDIAFADNGSADFSGMDGTKLLYIDKVLHKAFVDVNEEGTEAAAATVVFMVFTSVGPRYVEFRADHPFIFLIQENRSGNILFMGKVANPNA